MEITKAELEPRRAGDRKVGIARLSYAVIQKLAALLDSRTEPIVYPARFAPQSAALA